jgi:acyl-CoA synthetase (AMP-forming)/AMP-acid ligase II
MNLVSVLKRRCEEHPDRPALVSANRSLSFHGLEQEVGSCADQLSKLGIVAGDRLIVLVPFSIELYVTLLSLMRIGAVAVFIDPGFSAPHVASCVSSAAPKGVICSTKTYPLLLASRFLRKLPYWLSVSPWSLPGTIGLTPSTDVVNAPIIGLGGSDPALLTFTSGSTGRPKGVVRSHGFLLEQHKILEHHIELLEGECDLTGLPIFGIANIASGVTTVIPDASMKKPGSIRAGPIVRQIRNHRISRIAASPAFLERIVDHIETGNGTVPELKKIYTGGAPVFPQLLKRLSNAAPNADVVAVYGSTEAEPIAHISIRDFSEEDLSRIASGRGLLAGPPVPEIKCRIIQAIWGTPLQCLSEKEFEERQRPVGEIGEIVVSGKHVLTGYLNGVGDDETKFNVATERWHRTGDLGYFDSTSRLWLVGRASAVVRREGKAPLYPFCIECAAQSHPTVRRAALAIIDGQAVLALETGRSGADTTREVNDLVSWANLDVVVTVKSIPMDARHNAKVDYTKLYAILKR